MIETFRTDDSIRARTARLANLRKLAHQTDHLDALWATPAAAAAADEAQAVTAYAHAYLDALRTDSDAAIHARATIRLDTHYTHAQDWALHCRDNSDVLITRAQREHAA